VITERDLRQHFGPRRAVVYRCGCGATFPSAFALLCHEDDPHCPDCCGVLTHADKEIGVCQRCEARREGPSS
jgi:hypothetical protein